MKAALQQTQSRVSIKVIATLACLLAISVVSLAWRLRERRPRVWRASEVPMAFWAWRNKTPAEAVVERAVREAHAQALFLRAGQIDYEAESPRRIRPVEGKFPRTLELHLVYNATRNLLAAFERAEMSALAQTISEAYTLDAARGAAEGARIAGLQLDIDVPTRLLPKYEQLLRAVRGRVPQGVKLSITGLPTWMESSALNETLRAVDFWIPQCYGAKIPDRLNQLVPITSPQAVAQAVARARRLDHPFYAGLPAYGYTILYNTRGELVEVRGDLDPARIANDLNFELIERRPFHGVSGKGDATASEWRYVYRARSDGVTDNLIVREGETLMIDVPSAETLRDYARAVREEAGEKLLGICVFRLPVDDDPTALTLEQLKAALSDTPATVSSEVRLTRGGLQESGAQFPSNLLQLTANNNSVANAQLGEDALTVTLRVPAGSVRGVVGLDGFASFETLCEAQGAGAKTVEVQRPCGIRRANLVRLRTRTWMAGASARASLSFDGAIPSALAVTTEIKVDDGRVWQEERTININPR